mmetsp:Transcript_69562/g.182359  ORF Transcript_69562/g.182359 Transcript_69562/m.182359 type:complete len:664 (-) Transcript_69562:224-2215(-)
MPSGALGASKRVVEAMSFGRSSPKGGGAAGHILPGVAWLSLPDWTEGADKCRQAAAKLAEQAASLADIDGFAVTHDMIVKALPPPWGTSTARFDESPGNDLPPVIVLYPEKMVDLECCAWAGSGHYDMSGYHSMIPPHMAQIVSFNRILARVAPSANHLRGKPFVVVISTHASKAFVSVLAGSAMVLLGGGDTDASWSEILRVCPSPSSNAAEAWDRFPPTFSMSGLRAQTSLTVKNCLQGLEASKELGWLDFRTFNVWEWRLLREKFDASWLVPGDILALADPSITAQNPRFPGLLDPVSDAPLKWQPGAGCAMQLRVEGNDDSTACSPKSLLSSIADGANDPIDDIVLDCDDDLDLPAFPQPVAATAPFNRTNSGSKLQEATPVPKGPMGKSHSSPVHLSSRGRTPSHQDTQRPTRWSEATDEQRAERNLHGSFPAYFERVGIGQLVRLNFLKECREQRFYDAAFDDQILQIKPCEFPDGTAPKRDIVTSFIENCEQHQAVAVKEGGRPMIAVHCKGGLGRTGSAIAAYAVQRYGISGEAFHGFARLMRPGVIQTPEQEKFVRTLVSPGDGPTRSQSSSTSIFSGRGGRRSISMILSRQPAPLLLVKDTSESPPSPTTSSPKGDSQRQWLPALQLPAAARWGSTVQNPGQVRPSCGSKTTL